MLMTFSSLTWFKEYLVIYNIWQYLYWGYELPDSGCIWVLWVNKHLQSVIGGGLWGGALPEHNNRLLWITGLKCDWMWFKSPTSLWLYCLCCASPKLKLLITQATHDEREPSLCHAVPIVKCNIQLKTLDLCNSWRIHGQWVSMTPIVSRSICRLAC